MRNSVTSIRAAGLLAALTASVLQPLAAQTPPDGDIESLREQIRLLDQKLRVLERNQEIRDEAVAAAAKKQPRLTVGDGRIEVSSADGANSLRLRGLVQADARFYLDDANAAQDGFVLRRARLIFEGKFSKIFQYVIQPEFGGSTIQLLDANINAVVAPGFQVRVGRFKTPIGLEQLQSDAVAFFNERSIATNLTPNRDVGISLHGEILDNRLGYEVAVVNGVLDGGNSPASSVNTDGDFSVAGRLFATPFVNDRDSVLQGLGFGVAVGTGNYKSGAPGTSYKTDGQQTFFSYRGTTVTNGTGLTVSPQLYYYNGPFGLLAEYVSSSIDLANGANAQTVTNTAYNLSLGYVLTGEDAGYKGVTPKVNFDPSAGTWGAFEVVGRLAHVDVDDANFTGGGISFADPTKVASKVTSYGLGLNWYLSKSVRVNLDAFRSKFDFRGARPAAGALSDDEFALITRVQVAF